MLIALAGCRYDICGQKEESVKVTFPDWPPLDDCSEAYPPLSRWKVTVCTLEFQDSFYTDGNFTEISIKKNRPFCMTVQPLTLLQDNKESDFFKPAGFIYPWNMENECRATWEQGFSAHLMKKLFSDGKQSHIPGNETEYLISTFNWKKVCETIEKKINESKDDAAKKDKPFYNPWLLDSQKILEGICTQDFKAAVLNLQSCYSVSHKKSAPAVFSSFIPENTEILQNNRLTVKKGENQLFCLQELNTLGLLVNYQSAKNISLEFIFLPIYIEDI